MMKMVLMNIAVPAQFRYNGYSNFYDNAALRI